MRKPEKMIIYNLFPLLVGKFMNWEKHLIRASDMGFNWIFVNPIQYPGFSGSLYSIKDYFSFNPLFIDEGDEREPEKQVKEVNNKAEKLGLKMMVDLVINHCAVDSDLVKEHPRWFVFEKGGVAHPYAYDRGKKVVWGDLARFDHRNTKDPDGLFSFFLKVITYMVGIGFKGFRCDAAYQIPKSFWKKLISETKSKYPDVLFFAETLGCTSDQTRETAKAGFDYIFNSVKWWDFNSYWLQEQYNLTREIAPSIGFPESHDTMRLCEELNGNVNGLKQRYLFCALFSAGIMVPMGFEFGFRRKLHVVKTRPEDWEETSIDLTQFIKKVNEIKRTYKIFREEALTQISNYDQNILIMWKASTYTWEESLIIINKDIYNKQHFYVDDLYKFVQSRSPFIDVSPDHPLEYIPTPFSYDLRPGQGIVLMTTRR